MDFIREWKSKTLDPEQLILLLFQNIRKKFTKCTWDLKVQSSQFYKQLLTTGKNRLNSRSRKKSCTLVVAECRKNFNFPI